MPIKVIVFDFDGTLVHSNHLKYNAFFSLFPLNGFHKKIIKDVLKEMPEASRYLVIEEILKKIALDAGKITKRKLDVQTKKLARKYNTLVASAMNDCKERKNMRVVLRRLQNRYRLYLSSVTPQVSLRDIVRRKELDGFFQGIFGYPNNKEAVLSKIMRKESIGEDELLVVGDGKSDRESARKIGCSFFAVCKDTRLENVIKFAADFKK